MRQKNKVLAFFQVSKIDLITFLSVFDDPHNIYKECLNVRKAMSVLLSNHRRKGKEVSTLRKPTKSNYKQTAKPH
jgi:hypothetical protein